MEDEEPRKHHVTEPYVSREDCRVQQPDLHPILSHLISELGSFRTPGIYKSQSPITPGLRYLAKTTATRKGFYNLLVNFYA